jgi:hypothetical protein
MVIDFLLTLYLSPAKVFQYPVNRACAQHGISQKGVSELYLRGRNRQREGSAEGRQVGRAGQQGTQGCRDWRRHRRESWLVVVGVAGRCRIPCTRLLEEDKEQEIEIRFLARPEYRITDMDTTQTT